MIKVVFVCLGNICRSPMAEAVFRHLVTEAGLADKIAIDSAATSTWEHGNPVHHGTQKRLARENISVNNMKSRPLSEQDLSADYLIAMDNSNLKNIKKFTGDRYHGELKKLLEYTGVDREIADPYYTGDFDTTYDDVYAGCQALLETIRTQYQL